MFEDLLAGATQASVPGAFFVDIVHPREPDYSNLHVIGSSNA